MPEIAKGLVNIGTKVFKVVGASVDLIKENGELKKTIAELNKGIADRDTKILELEKQIKAMRNEKENPLVHNDKDGLYYSAEDTENKRPFCPACYNANEKKIYLLPDLKCPVCKANYYQFKPSDIRSSHPHGSNRILDGY